MMVVRGKEEEQELRGKWLGRRLQASSVALWFTTTARTGILPSYPFYQMYLSSSSAPLLFSVSSSAKLTFSKSFSFSFRKLESHLLFLIFVIPCQGFRLILSNGKFLRILLTASLRASPILQVLRSLFYVSLLQARTRGYSSRSFSRT